MSERNGVPAGSIGQMAGELAGMGWRVVPLYGIDEHGCCECTYGRQCTSAGKHPRIKSWQTEATDDLEKISSWVERWPHMNVGVALGKASGIVDFECDSPEAEKIGRAHV